MLNILENALKVVIFLFRDPLRLQRLIKEGRQHEVGFNAVK